MNSYAGAVLDQLDRLFNRGTVASLGEGALLERYVTDGDEAAFAALVARHGPMVLGICRRVLRDERDVEDAFQATFLVLVRRAGAIRDGDLIGRWLHGVAHRVAVRARAHSARRFVHEQSVAEPIEGEHGVPASADAERRELAAIVDEEVTRLPSTLRAPVVLCYLEGMSHDEAASRLRWPVGTVRSRMSRARDVLRHRLARRGITVDGAAIVASLARLPVSPEWIDTTVRGSLNFATHPATTAANIASARSVALARRVLQTMTIAKLSYLGATGIAIALALGGARTLAFQGHGAAKAIGSDAAAARKSERPATESSKSVTADPRTDDERIAAEIAAMQLRIDQLTTEIASLRDRLVLRRDRLDAIRRERQPAGARPASTPPPTAAKKNRGATDSERPQYIYLAQGGQEGRIIVVSPDGSRIATHDPKTGKSTPLNLPAVKGVRREVIFQQDSPRTQAFQQDSPRTQAWQRTQQPFPTHVKYTYHPRFFALDLDRDNKVTRVAAFTVVDGAWIGQDVPEPVDRSSVKVFMGHVFGIGHRIYALSETAKRWGALDLPPATDAAPYYLFGALMIEKEGRLYRFDDQAGTWNDLYDQAFGAEPAGGPK